jgi:protease secretion system membrane fusion protein
MNLNSSSAEPAASAATAESTLRRAGRSGLIALLVGFVGFLLWAAWAPLDEGAYSRAMVVIDTKRKPVQHPAGGIIESVRVGEGTVVREGQVIMTLDPAIARANHEAVRQRYLSLRAVHSRLLAEQGAASRIDWHEDLLAARKDPAIEAQIRSQQQLFDSRKAALQADLQVIEESVRGQQSIIQTAVQVQGSRARQLALIEEELTQTRGLVKDGYAPRNRQLELERNLADLQAVIAESQGAVQRARHAIDELRQRATSRIQEERKEVRAQLTDVQRDVQAEAEKLVAVRADLDRIEIRAPAAGQVVGLQVQSAGAVIQAGQKLMDIVPEGEPLMLEAYIEPHLIDKVAPGLIADVRFSAFRQTPGLVAEGEVISISRDLLTDPQLQISYFLARVRLTAAGMKALGERRMQPGMPADVVIKTGERSVLTYLTAPLLRRMVGSMGED